MPLLFRVCVLVLAGCLAACGSTPPYESKTPIEVSADMQASVWLRNVTFKPTPEEVYPVEVERALATTVQKEMAYDAREWLGYFMKQKGLAAASEAQAKYVLDVEVAKFEVVGESRGITYLTAFSYAIANKGENSPIFEQQITDAGVHKKEDNLTWGNVLGAVGAGLTGIPNVVYTTGGSRTGLQPSILLQSLIYTWRDAVGKNSNRYLTDLPAVLPYRIDMKKLQEKQASGAQMPAASR